jgi:hypothetical protein
LRRWRRPGCRRSIAGASGCHRASPARRLPR